MEFRACSAARSTRLPVPSRFSAGWRSARPAFRAAPPPSRIGVNLGDIVHEADGDIYGDGVNLVARLEGLAEPGGICVSQPVQQQLRRRLDFTLQPMGAHQVKNVADPVQLRGPHRPPKARIVGPKLFPHPTRNGASLPCCSAT